MDLTNINKCYELTGKMVDLNNQKKVLAEILGVMEQEGVQAHVCITLTKELPVPNEPVMLQFPPGGQIDPRFIGGLLQQFNNQQSEPKKSRQNIKHEHLPLDYNAVCNLLVTLRDYYNDQINNLHKKFQEL